MTQVVFDTNLLINLLSGKFKLPESFRKYDRILIPAIVIGEYQAGIFDTRQGRENAAKLVEYLGRLTVEAVPVTTTTAEKYALIFKTLRAQGHPIPQNDMWIAASALENGADLATTDGHFRFIPMLTVIIPDADT